MKILSLHNVVGGIILGCALGFAIPAIWSDLSARSYSGVKREAVESMREKIIGISPHAGHIGWLIVEDVRAVSSYNPADRSCTSMDPTSVDHYVVIISYRTLFGIEWHEKSDMYACL